MANEKLDLIDRKALIAEYDRVHIGPPGGARKLMEDAPAVDAVEVVRCKDCKHSSGTRTTPDTAVCFKRCEIVPAEHFCSYGESRTDG